MAREKDELRDEGKPRKEDRKLSALDRAILSAIGDGKTVGLDTDAAREQFPLVWEWLTKTIGGTDYIMQPAVISIQLGPEGTLVTMTHRDLRRTLSVSCPHLDGVLPALEAALNSPNPPVRAWGKDEPNLKKRRQR